MGIDTYLLPLFSITKHWALDVAIGIGYLCTFYKLVTYMDMNKRVAVPLRNMWIAMGLWVVAVYLYYRIDEVVYSFTRFCVCDRLAYWDGFVLALLVWTGWGLYKRLLYKNNKNETETLHTVAQDGALVTIEKDLFRMEDQVDRMFNYLKRVDVSKKAFSIGVEGGWGDGKSTFMNFIKERILREKENLIVMNFSPRDSKDVTHIQEDFLNALKETIRPYSPNLSNTFERYADALNVNMDVSPVYSFFWNLFRVHKETTEDGKDEINKIITSIGKRIVVFVDDLDRLTAKELLEVLKVIDKNGAFANVIFISGYDKDYVNNALKGYLNYNDKKAFTDKFFELEIKLPKHAYYILHNELLNLLLKAAEGNGISATKVKVKQVMNNCWPYLEKRLETMRDVKRFANLFMYDYELVQQWVDMEDYLLLELIKYCHKEEYNKLRKLQYIQNKNVMNGDGTIFYLNKIVVESRGDIVCEDILMHLFPKELEEAIQKDFDRHIYQTNTFDIYFRNNESNHLGEEDYDKLYKSTLNERCKVIDAWLNSDNRESVHAKDIVGYLLSQKIIQLGTKEQVMCYFQMLAYVSTIMKDEFAFTAKLFEMVDTVNGKQIALHCGFTKFADYLDELRLALVEFFDSNVNASTCFFGSVSYYLERKNLGWQFECSLEDVQRVAGDLLDNYLERIEDLPNWDPMIAYKLAAISDKKKFYNEEIMQKLRNNIVMYPHKYMETFIPITVDTGLQNGYDLNFNPQIHFESLFPKGKNFEYVLNGEMSNKNEGVDIVRKFFELYMANDCKAVYDDKFKSKNQKEVVKAVERCYDKLRKLQALHNIVKKTHGEWSQKRTLDNAEEYKGLFTKLQRDLDNLMFGIAYTDRIESLIKQNIRLIADYQKHACDFTDDMEVGDLVRLDTEAWGKYKDFFGGGPNVFKIIDLLPQGALLKDCDEIIDTKDIKAIPIDGIADKDIYFDPVVAASYVQPNQPAPIHYTDYSYYMDAFKNIQYEGKTYYDIVKEKNFHFVHEVQHWLKKLNQNNYLKINL